MPRYICTNNFGMEKYLTEQKIYEGNYKQTGNSGFPVIIVLRDDTGFPLEVANTRFELVEEIGENLDD